MSERSAGWARIRGPVANLLLFVVTLATTTLAGAGFSDGSDPFGLGFGEGWLGTLASGLPFSLTLLGILGVHEMGHWSFARWHRIPTTLPYFLPAPPFFLVGTFGAFIRMKEAPADRRQLFDVGASGPWAGFVVALPAAIWGIAHSEIQALPARGSFLYFGDSVLFRSLVVWIHGPIPLGFDLFLHPVGMAAWVGLFVTALNLIPVGQLDGGHVAYAMFGRRHRWVAWSALGAIVTLGFGGWLGWFLWAFLVVVVGVVHPQPRDPVPRLDPVRRAIGWLTLVLFLLTFVPVPISVLHGEFGPERSDWIAV